MERHPDVAGTGVDRDTALDRRAAEVDALTSVARRAQRDQLATSTIHGDLERMLLTQPAGPAQLDGEVVVGIERDLLTDQHAATGAKRQTGGPLMLLLVLGGPIGLGKGRRGWAAHRQAADGPAGFEIALKERLRHTQHAPDVVESEAGVVGREEIVDRNLESEQVADGVAILGAVQAMKGCRAPRVRSRGRRRVEPALEPRAKAGERRLIRARPAGWRHQYGTELSDHRLPVGGVGGQGLEVQRVQGQSHRTQLGRQRRGTPRLTVHERLVVAGDTVAT